MTVTGITIRVGAGSAPRCAPRVSPGKPTLPSRVPRTGTRGCPSHGCATGATQTRAAGAVGSTASPAELSGGSFSRAAEPGGCHTGTHGAVTPPPTGLAPRRAPLRAGGPELLQAACDSPELAAPQIPPAPPAPLCPGPLSAPSLPAPFRMGPPGRCQPRPHRAGRTSPGPAAPVAFRSPRSRFGLCPRMRCQPGKSARAAQTGPAPLRGSACSDGEPGQGPPALPRDAVPAPAPSPHRPGGQRLPAASSVRTPPALTRGPGGRGGGSR